MACWPVVGRAHRPIGQAIRADERRPEGRRPGGRDAEAIGRAAPRPTRPRRSTTSSPRTCSPRPSRRTTPPRTMSRSWRCSTGRGQGRRTGSTTSPRSRSAVTETIAKTYHGLASFDKAERPSRGPCLEIARRIGRPRGRRDAHTPWPSWRHIRHHLGPLCRGHRTCSRGDRGPGRHARPRPPRHARQPQQPRPAYLRRRPHRRGHRAHRGDAQAAGGEARPRPPRHAHQPQQPRRWPTSPPAAPPRRSRCTRRRSS